MKLATAMRSNVGKACTARPMRKRARGGSIKLYAGARFAQSSIRPEQLSGNRQSSSQTDSALMLLATSKGLLLNPARLFKRRKHTQGPRYKVVEPPVVDRHPVKLVNPDDR